MAKKKGKELLKAGLKGGVKLLVPVPVVGEMAAQGAGMMVDSLRTQTDRFVEAEAEDAAERVEEWRERIEAKLDALSQRFELSPSDIASVFRAFWPAYQTAQEAKKRELVMVALCNSFDPELYELGITRHLFKLLADLDYGELWMLKAQLPRPGEWLFYDPARSPNWHHPSDAKVHLDEPRDDAGMESFHLERLVQARLVRIRDAKPEPPNAAGYRTVRGGPRDARECERLEVTQLGARMIRLLASADDS